MKGLRELSGVGTIGAIGLLGALAGCPGNPDVQRCTADSQCVRSEGYARCNTELEVCIAAECLQANHCEIGEYCNENYNCIPGCAGDDDCRAGSTCNVSTHACEAYGCRSSQLDCPAAHHCDEGSGQCVRDTSGLCNSCDGAWTLCSGQSECFLLDDTDNGYCLPACATTADCPGGFSCSPSSAGGSYCVGPCPYYLENGWL